MRLVDDSLIFLALIAAGGTAFMVKNHLASQKEVMWQYWSKTRPICWHKTPPVA
jgi:hypothetical protein